ncbi:unnamed protein product [Cyprideis torosa]|uniref:Uncharacterized protein n=1 Tax=Cyprideis torosa TaxID=163714 RepID=A0A7R8WXN4_9CRUS|nr:unnamed protein product [Cyprideis torosa]CAG0912078.1 unnamed protein product [Cyprideis torosa]
MIVIADESKYVDTLGKFHLPVEVVKFGWKTTAQNIVELLEDSDVAATGVELRKTGLSPFVSDEGHYILDCYCEQINDPSRLSVRLNLIPGVVENGLFIGLADTVILGRKDGTVQVLDRDDGNGEFEPLNLPIDLEFDEES